MIRHYQPDDLDAIIAIGDAAWKPIYDLYKETFGDDLFAVRIPDRDRYKGKQIRSHAENHPDQLAVVELDDKIVAFITWRVIAGGKIGVIGNNAVSPVAAGKGIGSKMYAHVLDVFREQGCEFAQVGTGLDPAHAPARRAYEKAGFDIRIKDVTYFQKL